MSLDLISGMTVRRRVQITRKEMLAAEAEIAAGAKERAAKVAAIFADTAEAGIIATMPAVTIHAAAVIAVGATRAQADLEGG